MSNILLVPEGIIRPVVSGGIILPFVSGGIIIPVVSGGIEVTTLVSIGTDCTGRCKSNYHPITTTTVPVTEKNEWKYRTNVFKIHLCQTLVQMWIKGNIKYI